MKLPLIPVVFGFLALCSGCEGKVPPPPSGSEAFAEYYSQEVFLIEQARLKGMDSTALRSQLDSLRSRFSISDAGRDSLTRYFQDSLPRWEAFLTGVLHRLEEKERATGKVLPQGSQAPRVQN